MSECVVRMDMPKGCGSCPIANFGYCSINHKQVGDSLIGYPVFWMEWTGSAAKAARYWQHQWSAACRPVQVISTGDNLSPQNRSANCPIICQLPEGHGRLIDADAWDKRIYNDVPISTFGSIRRMAAVRELIEEAPTVEPASPWHRVEEPPKEDA